MRSRLSWTNVVSSVGSAVLFTLVVSDANAFFTDPSNACNVLQKRESIDLVGAGCPGQILVTNKTYRDLCDPDIYQPLGLFDPAIQYPGVPLCSDAVPGERWPRCKPSPWTEPDLGWRYPVRFPAGEAATRITQLMDQDWWPVCASADLTSFVSNPNQRVCDADHEEIGRCMPSAHYYERIRGPLQNGKLVATRRFFSFQFTHPDCHAEEAQVPPAGPLCENCDDADGCPDVCAHDAFSEVATCKILCKRYLGKLAFDAAALQWTTSPHVARRLSNELVEVQGFCNTLVPPNTCPMTPLDICLNNCGPPYKLFNGVQDTPPWVSRYLSTNRPHIEEENQWYFVQYGRMRDPNEESHFWMRSYGVNTDKDNGPKNICQKAVTQYCNQISSVNPVQELCARNLIPSNWPFPIPPGDFNAPGGDTDRQFCFHMSRGNFFCPNICYTKENEGNLNLLHMCANDPGGSGLLGGSSCNGLADNNGNTCCSNPPCCAGGDCPLCE